MKITGALITGGSGFIGTNLAETLLVQGVPVVAVDNFATGMRENSEYLKKFGPLFCFVEADVVAPWTWTSGIPQDMVKKISHVFHLASPASPPLYQNLAFETLWVNSIGLQNALQFADQNQARLVYASTSEVYGDPNVSPQPESYWGYVNSFGIRSCYDESKRFGEALLFTHNWKKQTQHGLVRIFNTYGPRMNPHDGRVIINFLTQALRGEPLTVYGDGQQTRSFCYVTDLVAGLILYAQSNLTEPINLGNDREFTIMDLAQEVQKLFSDRPLKIKRETLPQDDPKQRRPDLSLAKKHLSPWAPQVSLAAGLAKMRQWLEQ